jgi:NTP pyrophosphatase (non-canonical NTP hydrolase)
MIMNDLKEKDREALLILQEECAEVTQAISKVFRFGVLNKHPELQHNNKERLEEEVGDLLAMIDILVSSGFLNDSNLNQALKNKKEKLKKWSNIFK